ncbi:MAG: nicotinate-nucleotide adenylyltransferase [Gammaproteobacteria bacterium]|nr:nicotinate-nucleotide adenylyltransferase [Gammaproteobacteria bacterium]
MLTGVFGGTFDPFHNGHLLPALAVRDSLELELLRFVPLASPPHRPPAVAGGEQRLEMVRLGIRGQAGCVADDRELRRGGKSFTVLTLEELHSEGERNLVVLVGADAFAGMNHWHRWPELFRLAGIVVMARPGHTAPRQAPAWCPARLQPEVDEFRAAPAGQLLWYPGPAVPVSASGLREAIAAGTDVGASLPPGVWNFIREQGLYGYSD